MYRGRRNSTSATATNAAAVILRRGISGRRCRTTRTSTDTNLSSLTRANESSPIGVSYLSSDSSLSSLSSSSSNSSSSSSSSSSLSGSHVQLADETSLGTTRTTTRSSATISEKSHRSASRCVSVSTQLSTNNPMSTRRRRARTSSRLRAAESTGNAGNSSGADVVISAAPVRYVLPSISGPISARIPSRRRASRTSNRPVSPPLNDSVQITGVEQQQQPVISVNPSIRLRIGRNPTQPTRGSRPGSFTRRTLISSRLNPTPVAGEEITVSHSIPPSSSATGMRRTRSAADTADLHAALLAARRPPGSTLDGDDDCVICLCEKSNRSVVLPCMHTFCFSCIHRWLTINPSCPLCKRLAQRVIHSVLSDTEFTELLVSDLQAQRNARRINRLPASFDLEEEFLFAAAAAAAVTDDDRTRRGSPEASQRQSHHHYHYHLNSPPVLLDYWNGRDQENASATSLFLPSSVMHPVGSLSQSGNSVHSLDTNQPRSTFRWNPEFSPLLESLRSFLTNLVNNALRRRNSSLLDGLLLRQLVYIFGFESVPVAQEPELERDITPDFLATHEAQRQRLYSFIRRELRVLAPWLAYRSTISSDYPSSTNNNDASATNRSSETTGSGNTPLILGEPQAGSAVTAPLICGAPGLLADTPELDAITDRVVTHFTSVPMTNKNALHQLLSSIPALRYPLVPSTYLTHFCSEVIRFARYSGTLEQYDYAVCLYRRYPSHISMGPTESTARGELRVSRRDPRLAVYMGSACWPRLRPGFAEPQGLITHPLINWLHRRLFVHSVSGSIHPSTLPQTGTYPLVVPEPLSFNYSRSPCHPHCSRLASLSQALLEAVPTIMRFRAAPIQPDEPRLVGRSGLAGLDHGVLGTDRGMTSAELFPNRLVYQRILSELIDQARFSEALGSYFSSYRTDGTSSSGSQNANSCITINESLPQPSSGMNSLFDLYGSLISERSTEAVAARPSSLSSLSTTNISAVGPLAPALDTHSQALRRLSGLLLLFTARVPSGFRGERDEDVISELIHTPLMPMTVPPVNLPANTTSTQVIDLTASNTGQHLRPDRRPFTPIDESRAISETDSSRLANSDWHFLFQPSLVSWTSSNSSSTNRSSSSAAVLDLGSLDLSARRNPCIGESYVSQEEQQQHRRPQLPPTEVAIPSPLRPTDILSENNPETASAPLETSLSPAATESHWRSPISPCVIISSDSSSEEEENLFIGRVISDQRAPVYPTTDDESEHEGKSDQGRLKQDISVASTSEPSQTTETSELLTVQATTSRLSLGSNLVDTSLSMLPSCSSSFRPLPSTNEQCIEEPMDVDEKPEDIVLHPVSSQTSAVKRPLSCDPSTSAPVTRAAKLSRTVEPSLVHFSIRPRLALYKSYGGDRVISHGSRSVYVYHPRRRKSHGHPHSRSPIVLESSESDCEILRESIRVYSDSSSCSTSSTSSSSTSSPSSSRSSSPSSSSSSLSLERSSERSRSPCTPSSVEHRAKKISDDSSRYHHRHRHHRRHHHRRHHRHGHRKHKKQGRRSKYYKRVSSKRRRYTGKHDKHLQRKSTGPSLHARYYPRLRLVRQSAQTVRLNSVASPILISDEDSQSDRPLVSSVTQQESSNCAETTTNCVQPRTVTASVADEGEPQPTSSEFIKSRPSVLSDEPCHSPSEATEIPGPSVLKPSKDLIVTESESKRKVSSSSQQIFEPSNLNEFYQFLAELGSQQPQVDSKTAGPDGGAKESDCPRAESSSGEKSAASNETESTSSCPNSQPH
ncbi:Transcriptional activator [Fasciola hepatica]|uniref:RING-type E3 ubiquitin transferase n=1 Tax=Fasciola hepatica TaxID=6192 RepID=A0A4E0RLB7_FASHE|nr:Transcriptional activator [Fasciola hepatica]